MDYFYNDHFTGCGTKKDLLEKVNAAIRIIESGLVNEVLEYVAKTGDEAAKTAAGKRAWHLTMDLTMGI